ncbi:Hypothetical Protein RRSL_01589 [Ralstonia solanacearum UW551]|uniref:Transmembrane protein n=1 Tax=Ralstonia solanacearum (strain UW551) TaxID=342110 RepID=A0AB33VCT2_RALSU|nr:Hypothetical Protein RRSL_01589 [Ralstonia solanacearum UW551]
MPVCAEPSVCGACPLPVLPEAAPTVLPAEPLSAAVLWVPSPALPTAEALAPPPVTPLPVTVWPSRFTVFTLMLCAVVCTVWFDEAIAGNAITVVEATGEVG